MEILNTFMARYQVDGKSHPVTIMMLDISHLSQIMDLQEYVVNILKNHESFCALTISEVKRIFNGEGMIAGALIGKKLIGFCAMYFPGIETDNLGRDLGLPNSDLPKVAHLEAAVIHPEYRGNALQTKLFLFMIEKIGCNGEYRYLCATVAPGNYPSMKSMFNLNLNIVKLKPKYGNKLRYIFLQDMKKPIQADNKNIIQVKSTDVTRQTEFLNSGYCGVNLMCTDNIIKVLYAKPLFKL